MLVRRLGAGALCFLASVSLVCDRVSSESGDKQLARVKGIVGYQVSATSVFKPIFGRLDLPDDAFAVTKPNAAAVLRLRDSSEIDIGENTKVQVGAFNPVESGNQNTIVLNGGALHFNIRHPQGGQSNYRFVTATSQIAVRGTEGFLIAGANGTQVVCVSCAAGDVSVQVGTQTVSIVSNQTLTVLGSNPLTATTSISANPTINNPAVNQFNGNQNPFNPNPTGQGVDPTNSFSGSGTGAVGAGAGASAGAGIGGVVTTVGAAAAAGGVAAAVASSNKGPAPSPPPVFGPVTLVSPAAPITFGGGQAPVPGSQKVTVSQTPNGSMLTGSINCPGGSIAANVTLSGASGPSPLTFTVTANSAPNVPAAQALPVACTITVIGQGNGPQTRLLIPVNVYTVPVQVESHRRRPL
jgi:hypothetical protein